ncbi:S41 family peptidase [Larkinella punicea]|uniref:Peptidase S41 n=1 Tax=Larkinella punicea TaxID=2315727 RepID=A0A368JVA4_9BACT|nr:S41 family peptidase [Larkinella punicea]RCR70584.1 peptidase S41 [Larkinella punicea]
MKIKSLKSLLLGISALLLVSCNELAVGPEPANTPESNFDLLWQEFDRMYGLFDVQKIDWNTMKQKYRSQVKPGMSDDQLFDLLSAMLGELHNGHLWLLKPGPNYRRYDSGPTYPLDEFSIDVVKKYVQDVKEVRAEDGVKVLYGKLAGNVGYILFTDLGLAPDFYDQALDDALAALADTKGLVVDARNVPGGLDRSSQRIAGRFASERKLFMTTRFRNGPKHSDFTAPIEWYVEPGGNSQYTKPVVLLTNRITQSAGETLTLAMNQNRNVTQLGDKTYGVFSDNPKRELPNGWIYSVTPGDFRAADGKNYEGIGIAPKITVVNTKEDLAAGKDKVLEAALTKF